MVVRVRIRGRVSRWRSVKVAFGIIPFALSAWLLSPAGAQQQEPANTLPPLDRRIPERRPSNRVSFQGVVRDQWGGPVSGVALQLHDGDRIYGTFTDAEGIFRLHDLSLGVYDLTLARAGFATLLVS